MKDSFVPLQFLNSHIFLFGNHAFFIQKPKQAKLQ